MAITRQTQRKFRAVCFYVLCWMGVAIGISMLEMYRDQGDLSIEPLLLMLQFSLFMGLSHGIYDVIILKDERDCRPVWKALLVRTFYFIAAIHASIILCILLFQSNAEEGLVNEVSLASIKDNLMSHEVRVQVILYFFAAYLITALRSVHKKFGPRVFWNTFLGKSQEPKEEERVFMFIDLRHSTSLAEELGHVKYSSFLKDYYSLLSNCCEENRGEIYQIAGDGAFLTWKMSACRKKARPVDCFYDFSESIAGKSAKFMKKFGVTPQFKAGIHCGKVISTEVGNFGSEMAYHGDVLNTTARIQGLCTKLGQEFLISEDYFQELPKPIPHGYIAKKEGIFELRGKKHEILIFSLQKPLTI